MATDKRLGGGVLGTRAMPFRGHDALQMHAPIAFAPRERPFPLGPRAKPMPLHDHIQPSVWNTSDTTLAFSRITEFVPVNCLRL
jgi:hypothetical protein